MAEFYVTIRSMEQVQQFVSCATVQPFEVYAGNEHQWINAKDLMGMFSLDYSRPLRISAECADTELERFRSEVQRRVQP